jgi:ABC-2 type transport system ATP-binding protein
MGMDDTAVISVKDLRRHYGRPGRRGFDAVRGVTFSVGRGELFALLGANGAGKTSTMELLAGLTRASPGAEHGAAACQRSITAHGPAECS